MNIAAMIEGLDDREGVAAILFPKGWWVIDLANPVQVKKRIREIVAQRIGRAEEHSQARKEIRDYLSKGCAEASENGFTHTAILALDLGDMKLSGSVVIRLNSDLAASTHEELHHNLQAAHPLASVIADSFDGGWVVRKTTEAPEGRGSIDGLPALPDLRVEYWVFKEDVGKVAELVFSTPHLALGEAMTELFDSIALSVHRAIRG